MTGSANFPTSLDDDTSLYDVTDDTSAVLAAHHNNLKEAIKEVEKLLGVFDSTSPTALWYRVGSPTDSHRHDGATMQGRPINPTTISIPSGGLPSGGSLFDHFLTPALHSPAPSLGKYVVGEVATNLPSAIVIPGLKSSPDIQHTGAYDDDFETFSGWATLSAPDIGEATSILSQLRIRDIGGGGDSLVGFYKPAPTVFPFTYTAKLSDITLGGNTLAGIGVGVSTPGMLTTLLHSAGGAVAMRRYGSPTSTPSTEPVGMLTFSGIAFTPPVYLRIVVTNPTVAGFFFSKNGLLWTTLATGLNPSSVNSISLLVDSRNVDKAEAVFDWIKLS